MRMQLLYPLFACLALAGCCPVDPTCRGETSPCPGNFWEPPDDIIQCPCDYDLDKDKDLQESLKSIQQTEAEIANLIDVALLNNPTTQETWANARAAAFSVGIAKSALYPNIGLTETLTYTNSRLDDGPVDVPPVFPLTPCAPVSNCPPNRAFINQIGGGALLDAIDPNLDTALDAIDEVGELTTLTSEITISYLLLDFGGRRATIEAAKQALYTSNWVHNRQIQQVIISVLDAYYTYVGLSALLEARESDLKNAKTNYEAARQLFEAGIKNKLDVLQAQTDMINIELSIVEIEGRKSVAYGNLANAMGLPSTTVFHVPSFPRDLPVDAVTASVDELIEQANQHRPDLAAAYALHQQRKEEIVIARSAGLPTLGSLINLQENNDFSNPSFNNHSLSASLVLSAPLFSGYFYYNQEQRAREILRGACAHLRAVEINITLDVLTSYFAFQTAVKSLKYSDEFLKFSEETYEAALISYREGIGTILDLLTAQRALANARAQKIEARTQWATALSGLSFAVGTTGTPQEIKPWKQIRRS